MYSCRLRVVTRPAFGFAIHLLTFIETHSDFNFVRQGDDCIAVGPEPVPAGVCNADDPNQMYKGSSGWRKVPGNTCVGGVQKDEKVDKKCSMGKVSLFICSIFGP